MTRNFFGWLVTFVAFWMLIQLVMDRQWLSLFITVIAAAFVAAALEYLFGGNRGKHHL